MISFNRKIVLIFAGFIISASAVAANGTEDGYKEPIRRITLASGTTLDN